MDRKPYPPENELQGSENDFWLRLVSSDQQIYAYEDEVLQTLARSVIPIDRLESESMKQCGTRVMDDKTRDYLLRELLRWFKYEFFTWTDKPKCQQCQGATTYFSHLEPTSDEHRHGARRVEGYRCDGCTAETRFPRYNDPGKLLETRTGRCGEWANCFTLCCRAMGFEARFVLDWTDHVWTEVFSVFQKRWLHCDPCENACDTPLMYEEGWGKKLTYVIAFSKDEVADVTWRYSKHHRDIWRRRLECRELSLIKFVDRLNSKKRDQMSESRKKILDDRSLIECVELIWPRMEVKEGETEGRTSGDLQWRQQRGELGMSESSAEQEKPGFIFRPSSEEIEKLSFVLEYYSALDEYRRPESSKEFSKISNWQSSVFETQNVFRKTELDWKMVYLARKEKAPEGSICWKFDFTNDSVEIDHVIVKIDRQTYENGVVRVLLCQENMCCQINQNEFKIDNLDESTKFEIKATFSGGKGDCAWQQAQLFRASLENGPATPSFVVTVKLRSKRTCQ